MGVYGDFRVAVVFGSPFNSLNVGVKTTTTVLLLEQQAEGACLWVIYNYICYSVLCHCSIVSK